MKPVDVLVAGHLCLDLIPSLQGDFGFQPGTLVEVGAAQVSTGGAVSNVGTALDRLGVATLMVGKIGPDEFGELVRSLLNRNAPTAQKSIKIDPNENTSYTVVLNPAGQDRMFLHCPGANRGFRSGDVTDEELVSARHLHLGYPPLLESIYADHGAELVSLFKRAKAKGLQTSLDLSLPDRNAGSGRADWKAILRKVLPYVDFFLPSIEELTFMLDTSRLDMLSSEEISSAENVRWAARESIGLGAKNVGIKLGPLGLFFRGHLGEYWQPCFPVKVLGTTGSGDATIAGFLCGLLEGLSVREALQLGAVTGACCCEAPDAVSGIPNREQIEERWDRFLKG